MPLSLSSLLLLLLLSFSPCAFAEPNTIDRALGTCDILYPPGNVCTVIAIIDTIVYNEVFEGSFYKAATWSKALFDEASLAFKTSGPFVAEGKTPYFDCIQLMHRKEKTLVKYEGCLKFSHQFSRQGHQG